MRFLTLFLVLCSFAVGATHRSSAAKNAYIRTHACPSTGLKSFYRTVAGKKVYVGCPGYELDHVYPLCAGGKDSPANMQWEAWADAHKKDIAEDRLCAAYRKTGKTAPNAGCYSWDGKRICP